MLSLLALSVFASTLATTTPTHTLIYESFGSSTPVMERIALCESTDRQFRADGTLLISQTGDYGYFQINKKTWDKKAQELGLDYKYSLEDNIKMAKVVFDEQGFGAWSCYKFK